MSRIALSFAGLLFAVPALAADPVAINRADLKWVTAPAAFPKGAKIAVVAGDPAGAGAYVVRLILPENYKFPPHNHPATESVTVLTGSLHIGMGDQFNRDRGIEIRAGGYAEAPAGMNHYAWTTTNTIIQIHGQGPLAITYVNPADDPSRK